MAGILDELRAEVEREKTSTPKKKSVLDEIEEEVAQEPRKESELEKIRREVDVNPESLRARRAQGEKLTDEQQRIAFEAERERSLWDMTKGAVKSFFPAAWDITKKLGKGAVKIARETAPALGSAVATSTAISNYSQMPTPENWEILEQLQKQQAANAKRAFDAQRSFVSGTAQDIEETSNAAVRAAMFGTSITDLAAEKAGWISKEKSFQNYLARETMREQERQSAEDYPERASFLLSQSPLANLVLDIGTAMQGGTAQERLDRAKFAKEAYRGLMLEQSASFKPDEDISALGEVVSPIGMPARLVKPVSKLASGALEGAGGLALRAVTKPTIRGVNPLEGVGLVINWVGDKSETLGKALSRAVTGVEKTPISDLISVPAKTATYLPGKILTGTGRTLRDLGRQIDAGGIRGRAGLLERLGRDPGSADFLRDLFGPGSQKSVERLARRNAKRMEAGKAPINGKSGGLMRARAVDWTLRMGNTLAKSGVSGAALNGIMGAADIETAEEFGKSTGMGFGIGVTMGANIPGRVQAALDPTTSFAQKVDQILMTDPEDRRRDEDADLARFRATADQETRDKINRLADPNNMVAARERELEDLFQQRAEADYHEKDTTALDQAIAVKSDELNSLKNSVANLDQKGLDARKRAVELIMLDAFDSLKTNGRAAGLNGVDVRILESGDFENFLRGKWGKNLADAEAIVTQLDGKTDLSPAEVNTLGLAKATVQQFQNDLAAYPQQLGFALSDGNYDADTPAHLRMSNIGAPTVAINAEALLRDPGRVGLRYLMQHEGQHALENFKEVQEMQRPLRELFFGRKRPAIDPDTGQVIGEQIEQGIITDEWLDTVGAEIYGRKFGGAKKFQDLFGGSLERQRDYLRAEIMADLSGLSESRYGTIRDGLDSAGQALVDRVLIAKKNSLLGRIRLALYALGVEIDSNGGIQSLLFDEQLGLPPEALALMRQFKRAQRDFTDTLTYTTTGPDAQVEIPITELMTNRGLQEAYKDDVIWDKEQVLVVFDDAENQVAEIVIPPGTADSAIDEYRVRNGKLVDENGNELTLAPEINLQAIPDGSRVSIDTRIARNPDGSPKILTNKEIRSRARQRNQMIRDAIDNAPDDGSGVRLRDTGNGSYRGTLSPTQLRAIMSLPNDVVPPSLKRNTAVFNELLQQGDGSRVLMEYQPALRGGKYRALAPKIRDVVPIGFQFSKDGNFLATTISVSRMFDKMNAWAQKKPENLNLWGRDLTRFWDDVRTVLDNHNKGLKAEGVDPKDGTMKGTPLDDDPAIALEKKNRINDFFNLFNKDTEGLNPSRTKLPVRRGQDSADRVIMSARMDRINQLQVSNAEKLPVDYGKMTVNFMPSTETTAEDLTNLKAENEMEVDDQDVVGGTAARFLPGIRYTSLPNDPKKAMADFYMLNAMLTAPPTGWSLGKFGGAATMYSPAKDPTGRYAGVHAEKYQDALDEAKQTLIPALHSKIQKALYFAIAAELRHAIPKKQPADLANTEFYQEYLRQYAVQGAGMPDLKKDRGPRRYREENPGYQASFTAMENARKKLGMRPANVARFAEQLFRRGKWSQSYGGNPWGDIAGHLAQMLSPSYSTERVGAAVTDENGRLQIIETNEFRDPSAYSAMFQEIDRAYDLQHNTNTVFNKLKKYYLGSEGHTWIAKMLDFKANVANPRELRGFVSGAMGKLADAWFADMRADIPLTQDLEAKVVEQLPESFTQTIDPARFLKILKDMVDNPYRSSRDPFEKIASEAERIHHRNGGTYEEWKAIKKDQNAHIGLLLDANFGDLGVAKTDAIKLFRMLLVEGKNSRVTDKKVPAPINVPKGEGTFVHKPWFVGNTFQPDANKSTQANLNRFVAELMTPGSGGFAPVGFDGLKLGDITVRNVGDSGEVVTLEIYAGSAGPDFAGVKLLTVQIPSDKKRTIVGWLNDYATMRAGQAGYNSVMEWMQQNIKAEVEPQTPSAEASNPMSNLSTEDLTGVLKLTGDLASVSLLTEHVVDLLSTTTDASTKAAIIESIGADNIQALGEYLRKFGKWASDELDAHKAAKPNTTEFPIKTPAPNVKIPNPMSSLPTEALTGVLKLTEGLSNVNFSIGYVTTLLSTTTDASTKAAIIESIGAGDIQALGEYLSKFGEWASDELDAHKAAGIKQEAEEKYLNLEENAANLPKNTDDLMAMVENFGVIFDEASKNESGEWETVIVANSKGDKIKITKQTSGPGLYQFIKDDKNFAIGSFAYTLKEAAVALKMPKAKSDQNNSEFDGGTDSAESGAKFMPAWSADQLRERPEITTVPEEFDERPLRPRFVYRLESIENDPKWHELTDINGFTFFTTSPESAAALALNFAYDGYRPTSENFSVYRYRLPENVDIQRDHTLFNLDKMTSGQKRVAAVKNAHEKMKLPLDVYRYVPASEVIGTTGRRIKFPESPDLMKIYRTIRRGGNAGEFDSENPRILHSVLNRQQRSGMRLNESQWALLDRAEREILEASGIVNPNDGLPGESALGNYPGSERPEGHHGAIERAIRKVASLFPSRKLRFERSLPVPTSAQKSYVNLSQKQIAAWGIEGDPVAKHFGGTFISRMKGVSNNAQFKARVDEILNQLRQEISSGVYLNTRVKGGMINGRQVTEAELEQVLARVRQAQQERQSGWVDYLSTGGYRPEVQALILATITKEAAYPKLDGSWKIVSLGNNSEYLPEYASPDIAARIAAALGNEESKSKRISQIIAESAMEAERARRESKKQIATSTKEGGSLTWVRFLSKENDPENFSDNVQDLAALAKTSAVFGKCRWCTADGAAEDQLSMGDFWIAVDENGNARVGVRFEDDDVAEVRGILAGQSLENKYAKNVTQFFEKGGYEGGWDFLRDAKIQGALQEFEDGDIDEAELKKRVGEFSRRYNFWQYLLDYETQSYEEDKSLQFGKKFFATMDEKYDELSDKAKDILNVTLLKPYSGGNALPIPIELQEKIAERMTPAASRVFASNPSTTPKAQLKVIALGNEMAARNLAKNPSVIPEVQLELIALEDIETTWGLADNPSIAPEAQLELIKLRGVSAARNLAKNPSITPEAQLKVIALENEDAALGLSQNPSIVPDAQLKLVNSENKDFALKLSKNLAENPSITPEAQLKVIALWGNKVTWHLVQNLNITPEAQLKVVALKSKDAANSLAGNPNITPEAQLQLIKLGDEQVAWRLAANRRTTPKAQLKLIGGKNEDSAWWLAQNTSITPDAQLKILGLDLKDKEVIRHLAKNPSIAPEAQLELIKRGDKNAVQNLAKNPSVTPEAQLKVAEFGDATATWWLAGNKSITQETRQRLTGMGIDVPAPVQQQAQQAQPSIGENGEVEAYFNPQTGEHVFLTDNIESAQRGEELFFHEATHGNLAAMELTPEARKELDSILNAAQGAIDAATPEILKAGGFESVEELAGKYGFDLATPEGMASLRGELVARFAERMAKNPSQRPAWWKQLLSNLRTWLAKHFSGVKLSEADLENWLRSKMERESAEGTAKASPGSPTDGLGTT